MAYQNVLSSAIKRGKTTYATGLPPANFGPTSPMLEQTLAKFRRPQYGYGSELRADLFKNLRRQAAIGEASFVNRAGATLPGRSAGLLNRFREAARLGGEIYSQGALPLAQQEQGLAEGQRQFDIGAGLGLFRTVEERDRFLRQLMMQKYGIDKSREFTFGDFMGNLLGAAGQVGAAAL